MAEKAKKLGAVKTVVYDGRDDYADQYISQIIKANALYDDFYPVGTSIARPWQAKLGLDYALKQGYDAVAHGNKGRGAGAFQFNMVFNFLNQGKIKLVAPIGDWYPSREEEVQFALDHNIPLPVSPDSPYSYDDNLVSNAINYGAIDDISQPIPEDAFKWTVPAEDAPNQPETVELEFQQGLPIKLNGENYNLADLFEKLNHLGGSHGIGRIDMIENGLYGNKFKWAYEAPAAQIIIYAHKELEKLSLPKETLWFKQEIVDKKWTKLVYHSQVYSPLAKALMSFIENLQPYVNGVITLKLYKGNITIVSRKTSESLINLDAKSLKLSLELDTVPYAFEEYSFAHFHPKVFIDHLGEANFSKAKTL